jgi:hypothetical protein
VARRTQPPRTSPATAEPSRLILALSPHRRLIPAPVLQRQRRPEQGTGACFRRVASSGAWRQLAGEALGEGWSGEEGGGAARAQLWRRRERGEGGGRVARSTDSARVFTVQPIYMDAPKKNERLRFTMRHDPMAGKIGFTRRRAVRARYIRLQC